jgi:hypothetical protein
MPTFRRVFSIMFQDTVDISMGRDRGRPRALDHALDAEMRKQGENDRRRRPLFDDATRRQAAVYEQQSLHHSIAHVSYLPSVQEPTDHFSNIAAREMGPTRGVSGAASDEHLRADHRLALAGEATADQIRGVTLPFAPALDLTQTAAAYAGLVEKLNQWQPTRAMGTAIGNGRHDFPLRNMPDRQDGNDPIAQLAPKYTAALHGERDRTVSARDAAGHDSGFTQELIDTLTSNQVHSQDETSGDEREFLPDRSQGHGRDHGVRSSRVAYPGTQADNRITNDLSLDRLVGASAIGAVLGGFGDMIGQGDQRAIPDNPHPTFDRDGGWKSDDGLSSNAATSGAAQEAMAAVSDELERLRAAVRRTIDELERARGSVQPPLPSLPVKRGTFRIS